MAKYEELCFFDILEPIKGLLDRGVYWINLDGLVETKVAISHLSPWRHAKHAEDRSCAFCAQVLFTYYHILPKDCMNCWKIVAHPKDYAQACEMLELQKEFGVPSKTGMEERQYSGSLGGWSSFWYCPLDGGLDEARTVFTLVEQTVRKRFGEDAPKVILKRGCTEMEKMAGPSDKWQYPLTAQIKEQLVRAAYVPRISHPHPRMLEVHIEKKWIEWAAAHGDLSYLKEVESPIISPQVFYHESEHKVEDFEPLKGEENVRDTRSNDSKCEGCGGGEACPRSGEGSDDNGSGKSSEGVILI